MTQSILLEAYMLIFASTISLHPPKKDNFLLEVYWPPITFSTSIWLWWNAVLSPPIPKHDCTDDNTPLCPTQSPHPSIHILFVDQIWQTSQTDQLLHHLHTRPTVETTVLGTVKQNARMGGGGQYKWGGAVQPLSPRKRGGGNITKKKKKQNKTHPSGQQDLHKCVCFHDCNGSLMRHEYSATYQNKKHLISECTRQPTVHQLAMLVRH